MLTVANGLTRVPSPLKSIPSTIAFGCATPPTIFHPCVANRYELRRVCTPHSCTPLSGRATPEVPCATAAARLTSAHATSEMPIMVLTNFVFIIVVSFCLIFLFWPSLAPHFEKPFLAVHSCTP